MQKGSYQGEIAALISAISIAITPYLFLNAYKSDSPYILNFWKVLLTLLIMLLILLITQETFFPEDSSKTYILLILSGISGVGIADTLFFIAFDIIGPRLIVLFETLTPTFTGLISFVYLGQTISFLRWIGIVVTGIGIFIVVYEKENDEKKQEKEQYNGVIQMSNDKDQHGNYVTKLEDYQQEQIEEDNNIQNEIVENKVISQSYQQKIFGYLVGAAFAFFQALGFVLTHLAAQSEKLSPLQTSFTRVLTGLVCIITNLIVTCQIPYWPSKNLTQSCYFFAGVIVGPLLSIWSQQYSLKYQIPEITSTIIATSPLFGILIGLIKGDKIQLKDFIGSVFSIIGVTMVIWL